MYLVNLNNGYLAFSEDLKLLVKLVSLVIFKPHHLTSLYLLWTLILFRSFSHSFLGHNLQILESILGSFNLSFVRCHTRALTDCDRQCWQLNQTLTFSRESLLFNINVSHLKLMFAGDVLQQFHRVQVGLVETHVLWRGKLQRQNKSRLVIKSG